MKKLILSLLAVLALAVSANAQIGIVAGLTSSSTDVESAVANVKSVNQYHVGLSYRFKLGEVLAIQPAIIYNVKGSSVETLDLGQLSSQIDLKTGFLEIPVQVQAGIPLFGLARAYALAEPFVGYAISNSIQSTISDVKTEGWEYVKNRFEYGVGLGAGVELLNTLQVNVKYFWNLGNLYGPDNSLDLSGSYNTAVSAVQNAKCSGIAVTAAIFF